MIKTFCLNEEEYIRNYINKYVEICKATIKLEYLEETLGIEFLSYEDHLWGDQRYMRKTIKKYRKTEFFKPPKEYPCILIFESGKSYSNRTGAEVYHTMIIYPSDFEDNM